MREIAVVRKKVIGEQKSAARSGAEKTQARKKREAEEAAAVAAAIEKRMDDVCEADAAFIICNVGDEQRTNESSFAAPAIEQGPRTPTMLKWETCKTMALRRCEQLREEHHDELMQALRAQALRDGDDGASRNSYHQAIEACTYVLPDCTSRHAGVHSRFATRMLNPAINPDLSPEAIEHLGLNRRRTHDEL